MTTAVITPRTESEVTDLAGPLALFRKQVLRPGKVLYKDKRTGKERELVFDDDYFRELAKNFTANVTGEQVAFQLADAENRHTMDPERYRGEVVGVEMSAQGGLDVLVRPSSDAAAELIRSNPRLGVSARILEQQPYGRALQHVLATLDPKVTGMRPWEEVALSTAVEETVDLSGEEYAPVADEDKDDVELTTAVEEDADTDDDEAAETDTEVEDEADTDEYTEADDDDALSREDTADDDTADDREDEEVQMSTSTDDAHTVELANALQRVAQLEALNARTAFAAYADQLAAAGVPPVLIELARPVLELPAEAVIELSNSSHINVADILKAILEETKGTIELSNERGHSFAGDVDQAREDEILKNWRM